MKPDMLTRVLRLVHHLRGRTALSRVCDEARELQHQRDLKAMLAGTLDGPRHLREMASAQWLEEMT